MVAAVSLPTKTAVSSSAGCPIPHNHTTMSNNKNSSATASVTGCCRAAQHCVNACHAKEVVCFHASHVAADYTCAQVQHLRHNSVLLHSCQADNNYDTNCDDDDNNSAAWSLIHDIPHVPVTAVQVLDKLGTGGYSDVHCCQVSSKVLRGHGATTTTTTIVNKMETTTTPLPPNENVKPITTTTTTAQQQASSSPGGDEGLTTAAAKTETPPRSTTETGSPLTDEQPASFTTTTTTTTSVSPFPPQEADSFLNHNEPNDVSTTTCAQPPTDSFLVAAPQEQQQRPRNDDDDDDDDDDDTTNEEATVELAIKFLKHDAMVDPFKLKHGSADLALEACFLHALGKPGHQHLVRLWGMATTTNHLSNDQPTNPQSNDNDDDDDDDDDENRRLYHIIAQGQPRGFFILVDRLYDTLEQRIEQWHKMEQRQQQQQQQSAGAGTTTTATEGKDPQHQSASSTILERGNIALAIASVMEYLHSRNIVYRDLKPENIAFDAQGTLKLIDFGLAKELKPDLRVVSNDYGDDPPGRHHDTYRLTGKTGSRKFMAPEVAKELPYNQLVDVYSYGILLWEICTAQRPFFGYSSNKWFQQVVTGGERPSLEPKYTAAWPYGLSQLMKKCWSVDAPNRPDFATVHQVLSDILTSQRNVTLSEWIAHERLSTLIPPTTAKIAPPAQGFGVLKRLGFTKRNVTTEGRIDGGGGLRRTRSGGGSARIRSLHRNKSSH